MLKASYNTKLQDLAARDAIILYKAQGSNDVAYATINPLRVEKGVATIAPGASITKEGIERALLGLANSSVGDIFIPEGVLARTATMLMWWRPPGNSRVWFKTNGFSEQANAKVQKLSAVVPLPGLVFMANAGNLHVWAVAGNDRPLSDTDLLRAPFFNVWTGGKVCAGNVRFPSSVDMSTTADWEKAFFQSSFTHPNQSELVRHAGGAYKFWKELLDGRYKTFPGGALIPEKTTIKEVLNAHATTK